VRAQLALVCLLALLAHGWSLRNGFVYDDHRFIEENAALERLGVAQAVSDPSTHTADRDRDVYRPLRALSHAFDLGRWGLDPFGFHLHSLLLHVLTVGIAFLSLQRLVGSEFPMAGLLGAGLLAIHPMGVEVVGWVSSRGDQYALAFGLLGLALTAPTGRPGTAALGSAVALFMAVLGKESAAVLPLVGAWYVQATRRGCRTAVLGMAVGAAAALGLRQWALGGLSPVQTAPHGGSLLTQVGWALVGLARTAGHLVWPASLSIEYAQAPPAGGGLPWGAVAMGLLIACVPWMLVRARHRQAAWLAGWALLAYLPSSSLLVTLRELVNDRAAYPLLAPLGALIACWLGASLVRSLIVLGLLASALVPLSWERSAVFHDDRSLWTEATASNPTSVRAQLAFAALADSEPEAHRHLQRAVELAQAGSKLEGLALARLGEHLLERSHDPDAAIPVLRAALADLLRAAAAERSGRDLEEVRGHLAQGLESVGRTEEADSVLAEALAASGASPALHVQRVLMLQLRAERTQAAADVAAVEAALAAAEAAAPDHPLVASLRRWRASRESGGLEAAGAEGTAGPP